LNANVWLWHWFYQFPEPFRQLFRAPAGATPDQIAQEVDDFFSEVPSERIFLTDFTLHTVGIRLGRAGLWDVFVEFAQAWTPRLVRLEGQEFAALRDVAVSFQLDFDDAYQIAAMNKLAAQTGQSVFIVSYDTDFDRTPYGRMTPAQALDLERRR
jgi:predicted nucleic acid-binding protein